MKNSQKQNILILINVRWWNATAFYAVNIARILHQNGHNVIVGCAPDYPAYQKAAAYGLKTVPLAFYGSNPLKLINSFQRMLRLIKKERIEIINPHRSEDHFFALLAKLITGCTLVVTRGDQRTIKRGWLSRFKYKKSDAVITTCRSIVEDNQPIFASMADRVHVIYGSVDEEHFGPLSHTPSPLPNLGNDPNILKVGLVGRISSVKGQTTLIQAAAQALKKRRDLIFVISGKEVEISLDQLRSQALKMGIENHIIFLTEVPRVIDLISALDICVAASVGSETISRVVLEYIYCGKPVIASRINAIGEIIQPGVNGELFDPYDHHSLAEAVLKIANTPDLRLKYAQNSLNIYSQYYSEQVFYRQYLTVLTTCGSKPTS